MDSQKSLNDEEEFRLEGGQTYKDLLMKYDLECEIHSLVSDALNLSDLSGFCQTDVSTKDMALLRYYRSFSWTGSPSQLDLRRIVMELGWSRFLDLPIPVNFLVWAAKGVKSRAETCRKQMDRFPDDVLHEVLCAVESLMDASLKKLNNEKELYLYIWEFEDPSLDMFVVHLPPKVIKGTETMEIDNDITELYDEVFEDQELV